MKQFVTIEGCEGSGKSTLIARLKEYLTAQGIPLVVTREPGGSPLGESIRSLLLHHDANVRIDSMAELLLFLAARAQHIEQLIRPALAEGKMVLCDRFNDSTIAYQGAARKLDVTKVETLCHMVTEGTTPNLTLLLDIDPREGLKRAKATRQAMDRMESETLPFHNDVRNGFLALAKKYPDRIVKINASQTPEKVFAQAVEALHV